MHDTIPPAQMTRFIVNNQSLRFFNLPTVPPEQLAPCVAALLELVAAGKLQLFAGTTFPLAAAAQVLVP